MLQERTEPRCVACKAQVFYAAIRVCHALRVCPLRPLRRHRREHI